VGGSYAQLSKRKKKLLRFEYVKHKMGNQQKEFVMIVLHAIIVD